MSDYSFVVSDGAGSGKTSLIAELVQRGFRTIPESGRVVVRKGLQSCGRALPWADRMAWAEMMLERDLDSQKAAQAL